MEKDKEAFGSDFAGGLLEVCPEDKELNTNLMFRTGDNRKGRKLGGKLEEKATIGELSGLF